jgi:putative lipoprotein
VEGLGCDAPWDRFQWRASGNEPFWTLTATADSLTLLRLGMPAQHWTAPAPAERGDTARWTASDPAAGPIAVAITRDPCRDTMSGSYYAHAATVRTQRDTLRGCALPGTQR